MSPEKENTFRALKDEPLLVTQPIRCWFGFHKWTKYSPPQRRSDSIYIRQSRFCAACNCYSERKIQD